MQEVFYLATGLIAIGGILSVYFTVLIKKYVKENFVALLKYFLQREALTEKESDDLLAKLFE